VHCHAGYSRSAVVVAAYIVWTRKVNAQEALKIIQNVRPTCHPNKGFMNQLENFSRNVSETAAQMASPCDLGKVPTSVKLGDSARDLDSGASCPLLVHDIPAQRSIRCRMCRHILATQYNVSHPAGVLSSKRDLRTSTIRHNPGNVREQYIQLSWLTSKAVPRVRDDGSEKSDLPSLSTHDYNFRNEIYRSGAPLKGDLNPSMIPPLAASTMKKTLDSRNLNSLAQPTVKCSGYFLARMPWMEPFLSEGQLAGKITCPNVHCRAKVGSYDWSGSMCGCRQWITPAFCLAVSKVDIAD